MGTSRPLRGPTGPRWERARKAGRRWAQAIDADIESDGDPNVSPGTSPPDPPRAPAEDGNLERFGVACRRALAEDLADDPDRYGLRPVALASGQRLVDTLAALMRGERVLPVAGPMPDDSAEALRAGFVERVAGDGTLVVDTVVRRAAVRCAERLTEPDPPVTAAPGDGDRGLRTVTGELFCAVYRMFFGEVVGEFLKTAIAAKIQVLVPVLPMMPFGVCGTLAEWVADRAAGLVPNPCVEREQPASAGLSLPTVAARLLDTAFRRAVGLDESNAPGGLEAA